MNPFLRIYGMEKDRASPRRFLQGKEVSVACLFFLVGTSSWLLINGLFVEVPNFVTLSSFAHNKFVDFNLYR